MSLFSGLEHVFPAFQRMSLFRRPLDLTRSLPISHSWWVSLFRSVLRPTMCMGVSFTTPVVQPRFFSLSSGLDRLSPNILLVAGIAFSLPSELDQFSPDFPMLTGVSFRCPPWLVHAFSDLPFPAGVSFA